jgi:hypothetical protein
LPEARHLGAGRSLRSEKEEFEELLPGKPSLRGKSGGVCEHPRLVVLVEPGAVGHRIHGVVRDLHERWFERSHPVDRATTNLVQTRTRSAGTRPGRSDHLMTM